MRVGIHDYCWGRLLGGGQMYVGAVAEELAALGHDVTILHHDDAVPADRTAEAMGLDLSGVRFRRVGYPEPLAAGVRGPWRRYRNERATGAELSRPYDLFLLSCGVLRPWFNHAPRAALLTHFPWFEAVDRSESWNRYPAPVRAACAAYRRWEWARRLGSYDLVVANSEFTRTWVRRRWGADPVVVYPPVRTPPGVGLSRKAPLILAVGRLSPDKRLDVLADAFRALCDAGLSGWRLVVAGGSEDAPGQRDYPGELRRRSAGYPVEVRPNVTGAEMGELLATASVFWHGKGYGIDPEALPEEMEHFGIATVEAMAAGCVPVVFAGGGQTEIVRDGVDGLHWRTPEELASLTRALASDDGRRAELARAAEGRARAFSRTAFSARLRAALGPLLDARAPKPPTSEPVEIAVKSGRTEGGDACARS